jgi:hypothetical protein
MLAPMPMASDGVAVIVRTGLRRSSRAACTRSRLASLNQLAHRKKIGKKPRSHRQGVDADDRCCADRSREPDRPGPPVDAQLERGHDQRLPFAKSGPQQGQGDGNSCKDEQSDTREVQGAETQIIERKQDKEEEPAADPEDRVRNRQDARPARGEIEAMTLAGGIVRKVGLCLHQRSGPG